MRSLSTFRTNLIAMTFAFGFTMIAMATAIVPASPNGVLV